MSSDALMVVVFLVSVIFVASLLKLPPGVYLFLTFSCILLSLTNVFVFVSGAVRILAVYWLLVLLVHHSTAKSAVVSLGVSWQKYISKARPFMYVFALQFLLQTWIYLANGWNWMGVSEAAIGIGTGMSFALLLVGYHGNVANLLKWSFATFLSIGLLLGLLMPETAIVQGRLAGAFANANSTGFVAAALIAVIGLGRKVSLCDWLLAAIAATSILWSASRTSAVVAAFFVVMLLIQQRRGVTRIVLFLVGIIASAYVIQRVREGATDQLLFRNTGSRSSWQWAMDMFQASPISGHGYILDPSDKEVVSAVGSSYLSVLVLGGLIGLLIVLLISLVYVIFAWNSGYRTAIVVAGFLMHSIYESWLVAPAAPMTLLFSAVFVAALQSDERVSDTQASTRSLSFHYADVRKTPSSVRAWP